MTRLVTNDGERGLTVPMVAISIFMLLAMAALAVDLGMLYTARTSAQTAADASALAGAFTFMNPAAVQPAAAETAAVNTAAANGILGDAVAITAADVLVDTANRRVTVTVPRTGAAGVATYFARALGRNRVDVLTRATAECSAVGTGSRCLKPIFIPNTIMSTLPTTAEACNTGQVLFATSGTMTTWGQAQMGQQKPIRPTSPQGAPGPLAPSQYYSLDFGAGANTFRCTLGNCLNECSVDAEVVRCGDSFPVKTGNMNGPTRQGIDDLTGPTPDEWVGLGQYRHDDGNLYDTSNQLVVAPVWNNCVQNIQPGFNGQQVQVIGFVQLFVEQMQGTNVIARFVSPIQCAPPGGAGGGENGANTGPLAVPIRLVQTPVQ